MLSVRILFSVNYLFKITINFVCKVFLLKFGSYLCVIDFEAIAKFFGFF